MMRKRRLLGLVTLSETTKGKTVDDRCRRRKLVTSFINTLIPISEEVISIHRDDMHQSEGIPGVSKPPIMNKESHCRSTRSEMDLTDESCLSQQECLFPYCRGLPHSLSKKSADIKLCVTKMGLQQHVASLESIVEFSLQKLELLAGKKITYKENYAQVDTKLNHTLQQNGALNIRVESLERELLDKEKLLLDRRIKNMSFAAGEEFGREALLKLGYLDIDGILQLHIDDDHGGVVPSSNAKITFFVGGVGK
ncbi:unnamed protein product [Lactuca saligna]|uniref:Uncharacterized protein n=1 Tax=Lactuca saligna TaxID=75948 RepID=A0AA35V1C2_LACSI|nr:unnamed protein product [Lactuca saligna]